MRHEPPQNPHKDVANGSALVRKLLNYMVARDRIELPTRGFSVN